MAEEHNENDAAATAELSETEVPTDYLTDDVLIKHINRQAQIVKESLIERSTIPISIKEISQAFELNLFSPRVPPKQQENGTCEANPRLNFYPTFALPEVLATYHIFFQNLKIPLSCKANRTRADQLLMLKQGDNLPSCPSLEEYPKIFEGLGSEETVADNSLEESNSALIELKGDNPRLAVLKRSVNVSYFAYPALNLPPKVMSTIMDKLLIKKHVEDETEEAGQLVVSDAELFKWLKIKPEENHKIEERRKTMTAVLLVTSQLECMRRFFTTQEMIKKIGENIHYMFNHGFVKLACKISNVDLTNIISYMGILHENRLGQNVLHTTLKEEARRDYIRDTIFLYLVNTWQAAMGVWQQCLENENLKELEKILERNKKLLWTGFDEKTISKDLSDIIFPEKLLSTLQNGLPDFMSQSMIHNFRSFILERSGILPALANAFPTDFVPLTFKECPPTLWSYTYLMHLANYFMFHTDVAYDMTGEGLLECYCRCNLCTPHRCLVTNTPLLNETQAIGTFEIQGPSKDGKTPSSLKLTAGLWTSAFLRKFVSEDYHAYTIKFFENQSKKPNVEPSACVITHSTILAQLQEIKKAREEFLLKKGHGVYLDPQTGEEISGGRPSSLSNTCNNGKPRHKSNQLGNRERNGRSGRRATIKPQ